MFLNVLFVVPLVFMDYQAPHVGLALATSFSAYINAILLYRGLRKDATFQPQAGWATWLFRIFIASTAMAAVVIWLTPDAIQWSQWLLVERLTRLGLIIISGVFVYFVLLWLQGLRPGQLKKLV